jgi:hypothetical protein
MLHSKDFDMTRPAQLFKPPLSAFQFINFMLYDSREFGSKVIPLVPYDLSKWTFDDYKYSREHFSAPQLVKLEHMAPIAAMSDETFERLIGKFGYEIQGWNIKTRHDLAYAIANPDLDDDEREFPHNFHNASPEQIQTYLLYYKTQEICVNWHEVVDLYNSSEPDQQEAIYQFFSRIMNRSLEDLMTMPGPDALPQGVLPVLETRVVDGIPCTYNELTASFVPDQQMIFNFHVVGFRGNDRKTSYIIATTMSLEEAIAMATRYTANIEAKDSIRHFSIQYRGTEFAVASIVGSGVNPENRFYHALPARLRWDTDHLKLGFTKDRLEKSIAIAEEAIGVKWHKGLLLEDALGL